MFVLSIAARDPQATPDPVPGLLSALSAHPSPFPAERTRGTEVIACAARAGDALTQLRTVLEEDAWAVGLGIGTLDLTRGTELRAARGGAVDASAGALAAARRPGEGPAGIRAADVRQEDTVRDAQAVLGLVAWMIRTRSAGQWRVVRALREHPGATQRDLAGILGITQQTVSRALRTSGWTEESAAHSLLERLLAMIDLTTPRGGAPRRAR